MERVAEGRWSEEFHLQVQLRYFSTKNSVQARELLYPKFD